MRRASRHRLYLATVAALALVTGTAGAQFNNPRPDATPAQPAPDAHQKQKAGPRVQPGQPGPQPFTQQPRGPAGPVQAQPDQLQPRGPQQAEPRQIEPQQPHTAQQPRQPGQPFQAEPSGPRNRGAVQLSAEQRTRIRQIVVNQWVERSPRVSFDIRIGARVPRAEVRLFPVPLTIVEFVPEYEGYLYFVYEDEIVIVDPVTLEIVAVIPA